LTQRIARIWQKPAFILNLISGDNLTKKAYLNAITAVLDYGATLVIGFLLTPILVAGLGDYFYGLWQILNRLVGYLTPASGRPAQALKWTLANLQESDDYKLKRRQIGNTILVWLIFLPIMVVSGAIVAWFAPSWLKIESQYIWIARVTIWILVGNLIVYSLATTPQSILEGQNLGYKRMGLSVVMVFLGGAITWLALYFKTGIIGVAAAALTATVLTGLFYLKVAYEYCPWIGVSRPIKQEMRGFLGLSGWFLAWNLITSLMFTSDVVVLGILGSVESVTTYTLTKYAPETLISLIAIMVFGVTPGLGGIIGSGNLKKAAEVRSEIMSMSWLLVTSLGAAILFWNRTFLNLWVGETYYAGTLPDLLITLAVVQLVLIRNDANVIDLTLRLERKVIFGALSVLVSIIISVILVNYFYLGMIGIILGMIIGRMILSFSYPIIIGNFLDISFSSQWLGIIRPGIFVIVFFPLICGLEQLNSQFQWIHVNGWISFFLYAGISGLLFLLSTFYAGLSSKQRELIFMRVKLAFKKDPR
jgi:O-antigen/teichoic acid export membrane protein